MILDSPPGSPSRGLTRGDNSRRPSPPPDTLTISYNKTISLVPVRGLSRRSIPVRDKGKATDRRPSLDHTIGLTEPDITPGREQVNSRRSRVPGEAVPPAVGRGQPTTTLIIKRSVGFARPRLLNITAATGETKPPSPTSTMTSTAVPEGMLALLETATVS